MNNKTGFQDYGFNYQKMTERYMDILEIEPETIFIADDDQAFADTLADFFKDNGHAVITMNKFSTNEDIIKAVQILDQHKPAFMLIDYHLDQITAQKLLTEVNKVKKLRSSRKIIMSGDSKAGYHAKKLNAFFLEKPFQLGRLKSLIIEMQQQERHNRMKTPTKKGNIIQDVIKLFTNNLE